MDDVVCTCPVVLFDGRDEQDTRFMCSSCGRVLSSLEWGVTPGWRRFSGAIPPWNPVYPSRRAVPNVPASPVQHDEIGAWLDATLDNSMLRSLALQVVEWADGRGLAHWIRGDEVTVAFPWLRGSDGWLTIAPLDTAVIVRFDKLKGSAPFDRKSLNRLLKRIGHEGFVRRESGALFARAALEDLKDELELKALLWRLNMVHELAENAKPAESTPTGD